MPTLFGPTRNALPCPLLKRRTRHTPACTRRTRRTQQSAPHNAVDCFHTCLRVAARAGLPVPSYLGGARASSQAAGGSVPPLVKVDVAQVQRRRLGGGHLCVVEEDPAALLLDVAHVVAARGVASHVADEAEQLVRTLDQGGEGRVVRAGEGGEGRGGWGG